jgi:hypothetical protein
MEKLAIKPFGGLGNRLLVLDSYIKILSRLKPLKAIVIWERNKNLYCKFSDLFEVPEGITFIETAGFSRYNPASIFQIYNSFHPTHYQWRWFNQLFGRERKYNCRVYSEVIEQELKEKNDYLPPDRTSVYITYYQRFFNDGTPFYGFQPVTELLKKINEISGQFQQNTIGIHIRRQDHFEAISNSSTEVFLKEIEKHLSVSEGDFFLSSDDPIEKKLLTRRFGKRMITRDIHYSRSSRRGMEDAVIDLFCLSKTSEIWGSFNSTFGQVAGELGHVKFKSICKKME